jgi:uncharacterized protein
MPVLNALNWFEIPANDFERATAFYEGLLGHTFHRETFGGLVNAMFPYQSGAGVGGSVVAAPYAKAGADGPVVYLHMPSVAALDTALSKVEALGGQIVMPKTALGPIGFMALIRDTEGNRLGLHYIAMGQ